jgi:hypothetical protein
MQQSRIPPVVHMSSNCKLYLSYNLSSPVQCVIGCFIHPMKCWLRVCFCHRSISHWFRRGTVCMVKYAPRYYRLQRQLVISIMYNGLNSKKVYVICEQKQRL